MTILRCTDGSLLRQAMSKSEWLERVDCDMDEWAADWNNVALAEGDDFGVFEYEYPGVYTGHYFFGEARGKTAIALSKQMLALMFEKYYAQVIRGLTPSHHRAALWMNRQLGFKDYGEVELVGLGPHRLVILSKTDFEDK